MTRQEDARARREAAMAERRKNLSEATVIIQGTLAEVSSATKQLTTAKTHEAIEAAVDQFDALIRAARPLPVPPMSRGSAEAWEHLLQTVGILTEAAGEGEIGLQPQIDALSQAIRALSAEIQKMVNRQ